MRGAALGVAEDAVGSTRQAGKGVDQAMHAGRAWWDLMLTMQRASMASFSIYSPTNELRISGEAPRARPAGTQVIPVGEERLNIATRTEFGETTRIRRRVVAQPVEQEVTLREERVVVERRPAGAAAARPGAASREGEVLTETVVEMTDSRQVPQVWKSIHVAEEVVLRREVTEHKKRVHETLRRDVIEVEHDRTARIGAETEVEVIPARRPAGPDLEPARQRTEALAEAARAAITPTAPEPPRSDAAQEARRAAEAAAGQPDRKPNAPAGGPVPAPMRKP